MERICIVCEHGPHRKAPCTTCGCTQWIDAGISSARALVNINNALVSEIPEIKLMLIDILELLTEVHKSEVEVINARREELRRAREAKQKDEQQGQGQESTE